MGRIKASTGGSGLGRHAASRKRGIIQSIGSNVSKALWISLTVVFVISAAGLVVQVWSKGADDKKQVQSGASRSAEMSKREILEGYARGDYKTIVPDLEEFISHNPNDQEMREILASSYLLTGNSERSLKEYQAILKAKPNDPETLYKTGVVLQYMGRTNEAIDYLGRATRAAPSIVPFHAELARANSSAKHYAEAVEEWKIVLNLLPLDDTSRASAIAEIANNYMLQGELVLAKEAVTNGLAVDPDNEALKELESKIGEQTETTPKSKSRRSPTRNRS
ncbi:MAG TPA: tetratricopeptide repeat protein [Anaerolineae bacterium]|nr:tetratricopeptide repeat protein [Anaerolineae bacterium]